MSVSKYINNIAPDHDRTSCADDDLYNAAYGLDDYEGRGRCYRCTLIAAQLSANENHKFNLDEDFI